MTRVRVSRAGVAVAQKGGRLLGARVRIVSTLPFCIASGRRHTAASASDKSLAKVVY